MEGNVIMVKENKCAIKTPFGISLVEFYDFHDAKIGDVFSGNLTDVGEGRLFNKSQDSHLNAHIDDIDCSIQEANDFIALP